MENKFETKEKPRFNLLTNYEVTVQAMTQVEGIAWFNTDKRVAENGRKEYSLAGALEQLQKMKERQNEGLEIPEGGIYSIYGDGGITRWIVMADGEIRFSTFHDSADPRKEKTERAKALGFKMF